MEIIVYGSQYGTAKRYAEELAEKTGIELKSYEEVKNISDHKTIIYIGGLYASSVLGMKKTFKKIKDINNKRVIIATVGIADPNNSENIETIRNGMKRQLPADVYNEAYIFHLRGGIDYQKLNFKHRSLMKLLYKKAVSLPEGQKTPEIKAMIETYGKQVDFVDLDSLEPVIDAITP